MAPEVQASPSPSPHHSPPRPPEPGHGAVEGPPPPVPPTRDQWLEPEKPTSAPDSPSPPHSPAAVDSSQPHIDAAKYVPPQPSSHTTGEWYSWNGKTRRPSSRSRPVQPPRRQWAEEAPPPPPPPLAPRPAPAPAPPPRPAAPPAPHPHAHPPPLPAALPAPHPHAHPPPLPAALPAPNPYAHPPPRMVLPPDARPHAHPPPHAVRPADRPVPDIMSRKRRAAALQRVALVARGTAAGLCLAALAVLAADTRKGWALDSYSHYTQLQYSEAVNVIGFVYSLLQFGLLANLIWKNEHLIPHPRLDLFEFTMDQILAYLLISSASSATARVGDWIDNWGSDPFPNMANGSIVISFLAFIVFAICALISAYNLFRRDL